MRERWEGDARGTGVGSASAAVPGLRELLDLAQQPTWVAEEPEVHLRDRLRRAAEGQGLAVEATRTSDGGLFEVTLSHGPGMTARAVRAAAWGVIAAVAETTTHVREVTSPGRTCFRVVTGTPDSAGTAERSGGFAAHGHLLDVTLVPRDALVPPDRAD